jgi:hypothetical protein
MNITRFAVCSLAGWGFWHDQLLRQAFHGINAEFHPRPLQ